MLALLFTQNDEKGYPRILVKIAGLTLFERQARLLRAQGLKELIVVGTDSAAASAEALRLAKRLGLPPIRIRPDIAALATTIGEERELLCLDGACIYDERLVADLLAPLGEAVAALPANTLDPEKLKDLRKVMIEGTPYALENAARLRATRFFEVAATLPDADLGTLLAETVKRAPELLFDVSKRPTYSYEMRRREPYFFFPIRNASDNAAAKHALLNAAQKSVLDWPAWYLHRPIEKFIIYHLCEWPITPNQLTVLNNVVAFLGIYLFAIGQLGWALVAALSVGVLDGLDGKQARVKLMTSKVGQLEELFDKIYENGWYLAIAYWLSGSGYGLAPYVCFALLLACNLADIAIGLAFKARHGIQLDDYGPFERRFRLISGRRNTYIWTLVPFAAISWATDSIAAVAAGFAVITVYAIVTVAVRRSRLVKHLCESKNGKTPEPPPLGLSASGSKESAATGGKTERDAV